jgi:hypothetical protein
VRHLFFATVLLLVSTTGCLGSESAKQSSALSITVGDVDARATYELGCNPPSGRAPRPGALCRTIKRNALAMLHEKHPGQICGGRIDQIFLHVSGVWEGRLIDARVDACVGNPAGEELWLSHLPQPSTAPRESEKGELPTSRLDSGD